MNPRYDIPKTAPPGRLRLVQQFVNTIDLDRAEDWLDEAWFAERGLPGTIDLADARKVREAVRSLLSANNTSAVDLLAIEALNRLSSDAGLVVRFDVRGGARLEPLSPNPLASILGAVYAASADSRWGRLKACRNGACRWVFYDYSKNRSAGWCSMALCGNRMKTRAYRRRRAA